MTNEVIKKGRWARKRQKPEYRDVGRLRLQKMFKDGFGRKRSFDKFNGNVDNKIYSKSTFETYKKQYRYFCDYLKENKPEVKTIDQAQASVDDYLNYLMMKDRSAYSISTAKAALSKVFGVPATQFIATPSRTRASIVRSRYEVARDKDFSKKTEQKYARFTSALGLRRSEMENLESSDLFFKDGKAFLSVTRGTKGGRPRVAEIVGVTEEETKDIVRYIQSKKGRVFPKLPSHYDNHRYRAVYARRIYDRHARKEKDIPRKEKYVMRKDRAGEVFDKVAMKIASQYLGHNRINVIAQSYLYNDEN